MWFTVQAGFNMPVEPSPQDRAGVAGGDGFKRWSVDMTDKQRKKFEKLLEAHSQARKTRKAAAAARSEIKGLDGKSSSRRALASNAGTKAVEAELAALKAERRALKKLHAFAVAHADSAASKPRKQARRRRPVADKKVHVAVDDAASIVTRSGDLEAGSEV